MTFFNKAKHAEHFSDLILSLQIFPNASFKFLGWVTQYYRFTLYIFLYLPHELPFKIVFYPIKYWCIL